MGDEIKVKKLSKILSILLMLALVVTINFDVYAKSRSGGFKSSSSHKSSSSSKSSSGSSNGGFKSSSDYKKSSTTTKPSTSTNKSTNTSDVNKSSKNNGSKTPIVNTNNNYRSNRSMGLRGFLFSSIISRMLSGIVIIIIIYFLYKFLKRRR